MWVCGPYVQLKWSCLSIRINLFHIINRYWWNVELNSTALSFIADPMLNSYRQSILRDFWLKIFWKTNLGQNAGIHRNNLGFKWLSLGRTTGDDTQMNIDKPSCPIFTFKPEDRKEPEFLLCHSYQNSGYVRRQYFHNNNCQLWEN